MDYLLRDSLHSGVTYGQYDWQRLIHTIVALPETEQGSVRLGVMEGGWHAAETLLLARYFMFTQVYFHKTRVVLDFHLQNSLKELLPKECFPSPVNSDLDGYLKWDDWRVLGLLANNEGGEHGQRLACRNHYREITHTPETPSPDDLDQLKKWRDKLNDLLAIEIPAEKSWYKMGPPTFKSWQRRREAKSNPCLPIRRLSKTCRQFGRFAFMHGPRTATKHVLS